jgi:hypothetical protein
MLTPLLAWDIFSCPFCLQPNLESPCPPKSVSTTRWCISGRAKRVPIKLDIVGHQRWSKATSVISRFSDLWLISSSLAVGKNRGVMARKSRCTSFALKQKRSALTVAINDLIKAIISPPPQAERHVEGEQATNSISSPLSHLRRTALIATSQI